MNGMRKIYENLPAMIPCPEHLIDRRVELILLPLDEDEAIRSDRQKVIPSLDELIGAWQGEPLTRPEQGDFEDRELLQ